MADKANSGKCRSCEAIILWLRMKTGNLMPLDPIPATGGNVVIENDLGRVLTKAECAQPPTLPRYKSHFATCSGAAAHRHKKSPA